MPASGYLWDVSDDRIVTWSHATTSIGDRGYTFTTSDANFKALTVKAFAAWETVVNLDFQLVSDSSGTDIRVGRAALDGGAGNQLGECLWSYWPSDNSFVHADVAIDKDEGWSWNGKDFIESESKASMLSVLIHEIGHGLGLGHEDGVPSIMASLADPDIVALTGTDIALIRSLYGGRYTGGSKHDSLTGTAKDDVFSGGSGNDTMTGGAGSDAMNGGSGRDYASYANAKAALRADLTTSSMNTGDARGDTYASVEGLIGSKYGDRLDGNTAGNVLFGKAGVDSLYGRNGNDTLVGGTSSDKLYGGAGTDLASYVDAGAKVTANLADRSRNTGDAAGDLYNSIEGLIGSRYADILVGNGAANRLFGGDGGDRLIGGSGNDRLSGEGGNDRLYGQNGNDRLAGQAGNDTLAGGAGADVFVFDTRLGTDNVDRITDFAPSVDTVILDRTIFSAVGAVGDLAAAAFRIGTAAADASDRILYDSGTGALAYDSDGTGAASAVRFAILSTGLSLTAANFDIVA